MTTESKLPLVSIICVCYNHERFVREALLSAIHTNYKNRQIIVVDDHSTDRSVEVIKGIVNNYLSIEFIQMPENQGNCAAFNAGFRKSKGDFVIDFAADDVLPPDAIKNGVNEFATRDNSYGVMYGDALFLAEDGIPMHRHSEEFLHGSIPQGDIYIDLIKRYFVSSASMMVRRSVLEKLQGYDETLAYEDFDFWIRSAREFKYFYTNNVQIHKRMVKGSMSDKQFRRGSAQQYTTYRVCEKILSLNRTATEDDALKERVRYEVRQCLLRFDFDLAGKYTRLLAEISRVSRAVYK